MAEGDGLLNRDNQFIIAENITTYSTTANRLSPDLSLAIERHPELASLIATWPALPEVLRAGIVAMVNASKK